MSEHQDVGRGQASGGGGGDGGGGSKGRGGKVDVKGYWRANVRLILVLLSIWAVVSFGCGILFIEQLNEFKIGNLPLGFWFANQGSIYTFVVLIFVYAWRMDRLDKKFGVEE